MPIRISSKNGYCMIKTPYGIKAAHRLVMLTFKPIPNAEDLTIDHLNHNKRCNELSNLEWVSREENAERAKKDLIQEKIIKTGKKFFMDLNEAVIASYGVHGPSIRAGEYYRLHKNQYFGGLCFLR